MIGGRLRQKKWKKWDEISHSRHSKSDRIADWTIPSLSAKFFVRVVRIYSLMISHFVFVSRKIHFLPRGMRNSFDIKLTRNGLVCFFAFIFDHFSHRRMSRFQVIKFTMALPREFWTHLILTKIWNQNEMKIQKRCATVFREFQCD